MKRYLWTPSVQVEAHSWGDAKFIFDDLYNEIVNYLDKQERDRAWNIMDSEVVEDPEEEE
jgi:hypothetical protein